MHPEFLTLIDNLSKRPAMFIGSASLRAASHFIDGFTYGLQAAGQTADPHAAWNRWIEFRFGISHPAWHWTRILVHAYGSDRVALDALPELFREYDREVTRLGAETIEGSLRRSLVERHGRDWYAPEYTHTRDPFEDP